MSKRTEMQKHGLTLFVWDFIAVTIVMSLVSIFEFDQLVGAAEKAQLSGQFLVANPLTRALTVYLIWLISIVVLRTWNPHQAGQGIPEYLMVSKSVLAVVLSLAFISLMFKIEMSRKFVLTVVILGLVALISHRWAARRRLLKQRRLGKLTRKTLLIGPAKNSLDFIEKMLADKTSGFEPTRLMVFKSHVSSAAIEHASQLGITLETFDEHALESLSIDDSEAVFILTSSDVPAGVLRQISWSLEGKSIELIVSSGLVDFAGSRLSTQVVAGTQFLFVETPKFEGFKFVAKTILDAVFALVVFVLILPIMVLTSLAIWFEDRGPIFYSQERVGRNGKHFKMYKFRSMIVNADKMHAALRAKKVDAVNQRMFKDPNDPRLTKVGRFIRRYSIDELPQIFNVFNRTMSMVGPRPPLAAEVAEYEKHEHRRLLVKPGITGLWQVSGRSLLSWEETVRLDLYYVENWTILTDSLIIIRTIKAVFDRTGAY